MNKMLPEVDKQILLPPSDKLAENLHEKDLELLAVAATQSR